MAEARMSAADTLVTYTLFPDVWPRGKTERADVAWSDLVARISNAAIYLDKAHCPLISLAEYGEVVSPNGILRHAQNVVRIFGVELDYDGEQMPLQIAAQRLQAASIQSVLYTSPSHKPERPRWRVLLPLSEPAIPEKRAEYVGRANRVLGGVASRESFTLSQSFYIGRVRGAEYETAETSGRCIDMASDIEPQYHVGRVGDGAINRDLTTDADLRAAFERGEDRYQAMLKLSSRWAVRGLDVDGITTSLEALFGDGPTLNGDGVDLKARCRSIAESAVRKFGETRAPLRFDPEPMPRFDPATGEMRTGEPRIVFKTVQAILANPTRPKWLLKDILEENVLALMAGPRGTYKSFIALHWLLLAAMAGFEVVIVSAEGSGIDRRIRAWLKKHAPGQDAGELKIHIFEGRINFNDPLEVEACATAIEAGGIRPSVVAIDTLSKNSGGLDENSNSEVKAFIGNIDNGIRRRFQATVLLLHHTGHSEQGRARGASALEADTDAAYIIKREPGTRIVTVSRERFKDSADLEPLVYSAEIIDLGEWDEFSEPVTSIALVPSTAEVISDRGLGQPRGLQQKQLLRVLRAKQEEAGTPLIWTSEDLRAMGRDAGMHKQTARDAAAALTAFYLKPTVGGYRLRVKGDI